MVQTGLHAYFSLIIRSKLPSKKWFFTSFLIGSIIPDIDLILVPLGFLLQLNLQESIFMFHRSFSHSLITLTTLYLLFLIIYEIKKETTLLFVFNGFCLGVLLHIIIDILFSFEPIHVFWPLPINKIHFFQNIKLSYFLKIFILSIEFFFFRIFAWKLINIIIEQPFKNAKIVNHLNQFMKIQLLFLILFLISSALLDYKFILYIFWIFYIPSIIFINITLFKMKDSINEYGINKKIGSHYIKNKSSITNIE